MAAWSARAPLAAATSTAGLSKAALVPGQAYAAALSPTPDVAYPSSPEKAGDVASWGGLFYLRVETAGVYAVALGSAAWIDVLKDGAALRSVGHGHGPACSSVRKIVSFDLTPGDHVVQISGAGDAALTILVARKS
ncbi:homogentisate 1,2-dioxygenase [Caulobacter hibisci]|uniref:Homogentisate 1,2-dioxygenase n=1 Tax=Caulobacter hibisci TaxID=2035993 RepID=A0ABS0SX65_9CAUL|nr:homogentisate 1,2-dioxygenase [Caulobacter hibisci]